MNRIDLTGQKFGRLIVLGYAYTKEDGDTMWMCVCECGAIKVIRKRNLRNGDTKSCGCLQKEIANKTHKNKIVSKETRKKMSIANKGENCSAETRKRISENHANVRGKNSPCYNPNLTDEDRINRRHVPGYSEWRKAVYKRDNYTCQCCGNNKGGNLNAHHIESYMSNPDLRTTLSNGVTLCKKCHKDFHHQYGNGNNTRKQWKKFLNNARSKLI